MPPELPFVGPPRELVKWIAALACLAAIAATVIATAPKPSLTVFDRAVTALDAEMEERVATVGYSHARPDWVDGTNSISGVTPVPQSTRWLGESQGYDVFGYLGQGEGHPSVALVCAAISKELAAGRSHMTSSTCVTREEFEHTGLQYSRSSRPVDTTIYVTVLWGPTGEPRILDRPLYEVYRR